MAADYRLVVKDTTGAKIADVVNLTWLAYHKKRGRAGLLHFGLPADHALIGQLANNYQVEVWRRDLALGVDWYADFQTFFKEPGRQTTRIEKFTGKCVGQLDLLNWRIVAWKAGVANRSRFNGVAGESIMKMLATYNLTGSATVVNGRIFDGTLSGMTVTIETDLARGGAQDWACTGDNLLDTLYDLSKLIGADYDLVKTGATTWDFRYYPGQRGSDLTATVIFSTAHGNMVEPSYEVARIDEKTVAIVGGQGQGESRQWTARTGPNYAAAHKVEVLVDARQSDTVAVLNAEGDAAMEKAQAWTTYGFKVKQTLSTAYGKHYCVGGVMGDKVTALYYGISAAQIIDEVAVSYDPDNSQQIEVSMVNA
jgi:hypothetical protein